MREAVRRHILHQSKRANVGHIGSALSVADQAVVLSLGRVELRDTAERLAGDDALRHAYLGF